MDELLDDDELLDEAAGELKLFDRERFLVAVAAPEPAPVPFLASRRLCRRARSKRGTFRCSHSSPDQNRRPKTMIKGADSSVPVAPVLDPEGPEFLSRIER